MNWHPKMGRLTGLSMHFKTFLGILFLSFAPLILWSEEQIIARDEFYFSYSDKDLQDLRTLPISKEPLTIESFAKWDPVIYQSTDKKIAWMDKQIA